MRSGEEQTEKAAQGRECDHGENDADPLPGTEGGIQDERHKKQGEWDNDRETPVGALLALVFSRLVQVISLGKFHFLSDLVDSLPHSAAEVTAAHAIFDGDIARVAFAINGGGAVIERDSAKLCQ